MNTLLLAGIVSLFALAGCQSGPQTVVLDAQEPAMNQPAKETVATPEGCTIEKFTIPSKSMKRDIHVAIVLPPAYATEPNARFPVLYTLHGADAPYATFSEMPPLRRTLKAHPMIVTCFDGDKRGWYVDSVKQPDSQFFTFFFDEFIPYVDAHYRTRADGHSRGVTGFSMGGYGAFNYMLAHPDMFASASSMSGVFDVMGERDSAPSKGLARLLGPYPANAAVYLQYGIYNRLGTAILTGQSLPPMYITCGTDDGLIEESRTFFKFLLEQNARLHQEKKPVMVVQYKESPGKHDWPFWRDAVAGVSDFHWRSFEDAAAKAATQPAPK
jgi:S-formylglutathione hydrolase FrmB